jgi:hypothetical protein
MGSGNAKLEQGCSRLGAREKPSFWTENNTGFVLFLLQAPHAT